MAGVKAPVTGDLVEHPSLGLGKVVYDDAADLRVYFKDDAQDDPDRRIRTFRRPCVALAKSDQHDDPVLDKLPPLRNGRLQRMPTTLTLGKAIEAFSSHFPLGLSDARFLSQEVAYKRAASARFVQSHERLVEMCERDSGAQEISSAINSIYGSESLASAPETGRLNFMFQRVDESAYFDALRNGGADTTAFLRVFLEFLATPSAVAFNEYVEALARLPTRSATVSLVSWVNVTWLPFVANPMTQFLVKPTIVQAFASFQAFDVAYRPDVNYDTYRRCTMLADQLVKVLQASSINAPPRTLDHIDVQSFMWVVERYAIGD